MKALLLACALSALLVGKAEAGHPYDRYEMTVEDVTLPCLLWLRPDLHGRYEMTGQSMACFDAISDWLWEKQYIRPNPAQHKFVPTKVGHSTSDLVECAAELVLRHNDGNARVGDVLDRHFALNCGR